MSKEFFDSFKEITPDKLKALQDPQIQAILNDNTKERVTRTFARQNGAKNAGDYEQKILEKQKSLNDFVSYTCGKWLHDRMRELFEPGLIEITINEGPQSANEKGWYWGAESRVVLVKKHPNSEPVSTPTTVCFIARQRLRKDGTPYGKHILKAQQVFHWEA